MEQVSIGWCLRRVSVLMLSLLKHWKNPLGLLLAIVHAVVLVAAIIAKEPLPTPRRADAVCPPQTACFDVWNAAGQTVIARRPFHFHYETVIVKLLMVADIPAMLLAGVALWPVSMFVDSPEAESDVAALGWIVVGSLQWWVVGTYFYTKRRQGEIPAQE